MAEETILETQGLTKEFKGKMDEAVKKFFTEVGRVRLLPAGKEVLDEVKGVAPIP